MAKALKNIVEAYTANIYLLKVNYRNTTEAFEICSKLTIKTPPLHQ